MNIITTIVGSYPTRSFRAESFNEKVTQTLGLYDPYKQAIKNTVTSFVNKDIDIICDGQVRGDMVQIFARKINGLKIIENTTHIIGKITPAAHPISIRDLQLAYKTAKALNPQYELNAPLDGIFKHEMKGIKGIITGPTTLVHSSIIDNFYTSKENAIYDMARALSIEAQAIEKFGACALQIDEPFISTGAEDIEVSRKAIEIIVDSVDIPVILHVCGDLEHVLGDLLKFNVDVLDFEFSGMKQNIDHLEKKWTSDCNKLLGIGCVNTKLKSVDKKENVHKTIKDVLSITKSSNIILDPDCGMRMLDKDIADEKLDILKYFRENGV